MRAQDHLEEDQPAVVDMQTQNPAPTGKTKPAATTDSKWRLIFSPYLWFPGIHGTTSVREHNASIHASATDLLSHFRFGLMGAAEARYQRFVLYGDLMWVRLRDDHALPITDPLALSAEVKGSELIWTSKGGYRVIDDKRFQADMTVGVRFWHCGQELSLNPSPLGNSISGSQNWADLLVGGRLQVPLGEKAAISVGGDVGGWGAQAQLDYQITVLLGYKVSSRWTLEGGYRYPFIDYRKGAGVFNIIQDGLISAPLTGSNKKGAMNSASALRACF